MVIDCDVLVVGGGPAGCSAARASANNGLKTILVEEHSEIGKPVQCAEGIGKYLIPFLPFKIPKNQLIWEIKGMTFWADNLILKRDGGIWSGYTIDRVKWDQWLANLASDSGAQIRVNSSLKDIIYDDTFHVKKTIIESNNKKIEINPRIVIAADGVESTVVDKLGVRNKIKNPNSEILSYEMKNLNLTYPHHDQVYSLDFASDGYSYIFPISKNRANIGFGSISRKKNIDEYFQRFTEIPFVNKQVKKGKILVEKKGIAPFRYETDRWVYGNVILTGDSANQNVKPFIEGNIPGIICGDIAGNIAYNSLKQKKDITNYPEEVKKSLGIVFKSSDEILNLMLDVFDQKNIHLLNILYASNICSLKKTRQMFEVERELIIDEIKKYKSNKFKQLSTKLIEKYYLFYLKLWKKTRF